MKRTSQIHSLSSRFQTKTTPHVLPLSLSDRSTSRANQTRSKRQLDDIERELSEFKKWKHSDKPFSSNSRSNHKMLLLYFLKCKINLNKRKCP